MKQIFRVQFFCISTLVVSACTQPGEMTGMSAAAGGVVGAGLGAIVGSQTGNAGAGLAIGAVAGAGAGAAVGNVLEAQDQAIRQQDEAIERQEQVIRAQRGEIDELRRLGQDSVRFRSKPGYRSESVALKPGQPRASLSGQAAQKPFSQSPISARSNDLRNIGVSKAPPSIPAPIAAVRINQPESAPSVGRPAPAVVANRNPKMPEVVAEQPGQRIQSNDMTGIASVEDSSPATEALNQERAAKAEPETKSEVARVAPQNSEPASADCLSAESEFQQAASKSETPDKLFHLRRALRLCPDEPRFHASLGDVYKILGRQSDAQFEYQEALKLSPGNPEVKEKISALGGGSKEQY